ncbi:hypothetical protein OTK49_02535 [Vibrio coralliirubri]|uniref:hypothetical protein n=1 Tax=Vibrio coralliirubri TaxID=1516159 RepID=UPI002284AE6A|nr:hypothetical protein [Vibrio coralliirubri]MCY9861394.1 hypothetical protein [Vibrio coralliirubri]
MNFNKTLISELFDNNIRIENVFYMQLLTACDSLPETFWEVFDQNSMDILSALGLKDKDTSEYSDLRAKSELSEFLHDNSVSGVLLNVATPVARNVTFDEDGEFSNCSSGWNWFTTDFVHADTIENALIKAQEWQKKTFDDEVAKAKVEYFK